MDSKKIIWHINNDFQKKMLTALSFIMAKIWKQPKLWYCHKMEYNAATKNGVNEALKIGSHFSGNYEIKKLKVQQCSVGKVWSLAYKNAEKRQEVHKNVNSLNVTGLWMVSVHIFTLFKCLTMNINYIYKLQTDKLCIYSSNIIDLFYMYYNKPNVIKFINYIHNINYYL